MAALIVVIGGGAFSVAILLQQQSSAATTGVANHNKCSGGDIVTCTHSKKTHHPAKDSTPFHLPIPFP
jgi:hypothetical protein